MITALLIVLIAFLYLIGVIVLLAIELAFVAVMFLWPILLPVTIGWKLLIGAIWLIILFIINAE